MKQFLIKCSSSIFFGGAYSLTKEKIIHK